VSDVIANPQAMDFSPTVSAEAVVDQIDGGEKHMLLRIAGSVFSLGYNGAGRLGLSASVISGLSSSTTYQVYQTVTQPTRVDTLPSTPAPADVSAGKDHSLVVLADGALYAAGSNNFGQLGLGDPSSAPSAPTFTRVTLPGGEAVLMAHAGSYFSLVWATNSTGISYMYGVGQHFGEIYQAGVRSLQFTKVRFPEELYPDGNITVIEVASGLRHVLFVTDQGHLLSWGRNLEGQCGYHADQEELPAPARLTRGADNVDLSQEFFVHVAAGDYHSLAVTRDGKVYVFGKNSDLQLGLDGSTTYVWLATQLDFRAHMGYPAGYAAKVEAGRFHSFVIDTGGRLMRIESQNYCVNCCDDVGSVFGMGLDTSGSLGN
jgi:alpha-tubulin suppressor-like RCC1 family protein